MAEQYLKFGDYRAHENFLVDFYGLIITDPNLFIYYDPILFSSPEDIGKIMELFPGIYKSIYVEPMNYQGIAGFIQYSRLRLGWKLFVSMKQSFIKGNQGAFEAITRSLINYYFKNFADRYLYMEIISESIEQIQAIENIGMQCTGEGMVFYRGKEITTKLYRMSRQEE